MTKCENDKIINLFIEASHVMDSELKPIPEGACCDNCGNQFCREKGKRMAAECKEFGNRYWEVNK